jgi:hypothetical protein
MIRKYATPPKPGTKLAPEKVESEAPEQKVDDDSKDE